MKISIIIPTLEESENLSEILPLLNETTPHEIFVVDAQYCARSEEVCQQNAAKYLVSKVAKRACQMNIGAKKSTGDVLHFIHADTRPPKSYKSDVKLALENGADLGCFRFRFDSDRTLLRFNSYMTRFKGLQFRGGDQTLFIKKEVFEELGAYDEDFCIMEEYELIKKSKEKFNFTIIPKDVVVSDRKYDENSYIRVNIANTVAFSMYKFGAAPQKIRSVYQKLIKHPKST